MYTSIGLLAFAGLWNAAGFASLPEVAWKRSYSDAYVEGQKAKKPLAVIMGAGPNGYQKVIQEGTFTSDIRKILANEFIPVYLDADKADDLRLIRSLGITSNQGIVLSNRTCDLQAFFHDGSLSEAELTRQLWRSADPTMVVTSTATVSTYTQRTSYYPSMGGTTSGYQPSVNFAPASSSRNC